MFPDRKKKTVDFPYFNACYLSGRESNLYFLVLKCVTRVERNGIDISIALKYVIRQSADIPLLNKALQELYRWCLLNRLTPHPGKSEVMIISKKTIMGPIPLLLLGDSVLRYLTKTRLLGMTVDGNPTWVPHVLDLKKSS